MSGEEEIELVLPDKWVELQELTSDRRRHPVNRIIWSWAEELVNWRDYDFLHAIERVEESLGCSIVVGVEPRSLANHEEIAQRSPIRSAYSGLVVGGDDGISVILEGDTDAGVGNG